MLTLINESVKTINNLLLEKLMCEHMSLWTLWQRLTLLWSSCILSTPSHVSYFMVGTPIILLCNAQKLCDGTRLHKHIIEATIFTGVGVGQEEVVFFPRIPLIPMCLKCMRFVLNDITVVRRFSYIKIWFLFPDYHHFQLNWKISLLASSILDILFV